MKLEIKAFRGLKDKTIELPQTGLVRIAGNSEAGKSTVLQAINWVLYGDEAIKSVTPLGETKAGVILTGLSGIESVERYKGPGRLIVNGSLENEVAQAEIVRVLGMSSEQFSASSYVKQKLKGSLLTLGAADQIRFIQTLAFGAQDPEKYKKVIQDKLSSYSQTLSIKTSLRAQAQENLTKSKEHLETLEHPEVPLEEVSQDYALEAAAVNSCLNTTRATIQTQTALMNHPSRTFAPMADALRREVDSLEAALPSKSALESQLSNVSKAIQETSQVLAEAGDTIARQKLKKDAEEKITLALQAGPSTSFDQAKEGISSADTNLSVIRQSLASLAAEKAQARQALNSVYECPECKAPLTFASNTLHHAHDGSAKSALLERLAALESQEEQARGFVLDWERYRASCVQQKQGFEEGLTLLAKAGTVTEVDQEGILQAHTQKLQSLEAERGQVSQALGGIQSLERELTSKREQLSSLASKVVDNLPPIADLEESLRSLETTSADLRARLGVLEKEQNERYLRKTARDRALVLDQAFQAALRAHRGLEESLNKVVAEEDLFNRQAAAAHRLKKISDEAGMAAVGQIVNSVNTHLKAHTDVLFPDGGTHILITNESFTKKEERRAKMGIRIVHRGLEMSLDDFSGGAENRAILCAQLAISDLQNSPLLLLDESLTGSHADLRDEILDHLRTVAQTKLILLVEHGVSDSSFDDVIYI